MGWGGARLGLWGGVEHSLEHSFTGLRNCWCLATAESRAELVCSAA